MTAIPINPDFTHPLRLTHANLGPAVPETLATVGGPMRRADVDVPISPSPSPNDTQLFLHPTEVRQRFWLPRYHIAQERVSNEDRYRISFAETDAGWQLTLRLEPHAAPEIANVTNRFPVLEHDLEVALSYSVQGGGPSTKTLSFQEILRDDTGVDATLTFNGLPQRDEVFTVLSDASRLPALTVHRNIRVAVEERRETLGAEAAAPNIGVLQPGVVRLDPRVVRPIRPIGPIVVHPVHPVQIALPTPVIKQIHTERVTIRNTEFIRYWLAVSNWHEYHDSLFAKSPDLPPCGSNTNAARTWVDVLDGQSNARLQGYCAFGKKENLQKFWVARKAVDPNPLRTVKVKLTDRRTNRTVVSNAIRLQGLPPPPPPEPKFLILTADMKQQVEPTPFAFSRDLHGYIFTGVGNGGGAPGGGGLIRHRDSFDGFVHSYFQDAVERNLFYFIADDFRIARRGGVSRPPLMTLRVRSNGGSTENTNVTWDLAVTPYINPARLDAARARLATLTSQDADAITFQPYVTSDVKFTIQRPTATGSVREEQPSNALMLERPIIETLAIPVVDFQLAFDAMLGRTASALTGKVEVEIEGWDTETRPFIADFAKLAGPPVDVIADVETGAATLTLTNVTESPLTLTNPVFRATRGEASESFHPSNPVAAGTELAAGATTTVLATLPDLEADGALSLSLESGAQVQPDEEKILDAILDRTTLSYFRDINVMAVSILFNAPPDRPQDQIHTLMVEFEGGNTVVLDQNTLTGTSRIDYPFDDVILRKVEFDDNYRYSRTIVRIDLRTERDAEPKTSNAQTLLLSDTHIVQPG